MNPVERLRKELLESMGLTEESLAALPPEQREAIEEENRRTIKERLGIDDTQQAGPPGRAIRGRHGGSEGLTGLCFHPSSFPRESQLTNGAKRGISPP